MVARPVLQDLAAETGLTASLFRRVGWSRVVLARVEGSRPLRDELPVGERLPLHLGAGKTITAWLTSEEIDEFLAQGDDLVGPDGPALDHDAFRADLKRIRDRGYSHAYGERVPGMASVAAPVIDPDGAVIAAVQVAGHQEDVPLSGSKLSASKSNAPLPPSPDGPSGHLHQELTTGRRSADPNASGAALPRWCDPPCPPPPVRRGAP
jgi:DNA-binding IclR family transcriptional regulator